MDSLNSFEAKLISRRNFITSGVSSLVITSLVSNPLELIFTSRAIKAIAFDAFPIFDPRHVFNSARTLFGEKGEEFANQWRTSQFEYTWLRTAGSRYKDFWQVTEDALLFAAKKCGITMSENSRRQLMEQYLHLPLWPDVLSALQRLQQKEIRVCFLSNMTDEMLSQNIKNSGIGNYFEKVISTDLSRTYKPDPKAYELGCKILQLKNEEILFVAFAGWDACGAKWFGYPTFWMNRLNSVPEVLDVQPDAMDAGMTGLLDFVTKRY